MAEKWVILGAEVKRLRLAKGLVLRDLAEQVTGKPNPSAIGNIENGKRAFRMQSKFAEKLSEVLGVPLSHWTPFTSDGHVAEKAAPIIQRVSVAGDPLHDVPMLGYVSAGGGVDKPSKELWVEGRAKWKSDGSYIVTGMSMADAGIYHGDTIFIRERDPRDGNTVVAFLADINSMVVKTYTVDARGKVYLKSQDNSRPRNPIVFDEEAGDHIFGVFVGLIRDADGSSLPVKKWRKK